MVSDSRPLRAAGPSAAPPGRGDTRTAPWLRGERSRTHEGESKEPTEEERRMRVTGAPAGPGSGETGVPEARLPLGPRYDGLRFSAGGGDEAGAIDGADEPSCSSLLPKPDGGLRRLFLALACSAEAVSCEMTVPKNWRG